MYMQVNLWQLLAAAGGAVIALLGLGLPAMYWAVKTAVKQEVTALELRIREKYMTADSCRAIREECAQHRHESADALVRQLTKGKT